MQVILQYGRFVLKTESLSVTELLEILRKKNPGEKKYKAKREEFINFLTKWMF